MTQEYMDIEGVKIIKTKNVFYNPAQQLNRDISTSVINEYIKDISSPRIFEAMSATGLRGIRYAKELKKDAKIYLNDLDKDAVNIIKKNIELNNIDHKNVEVSNADCRVLMMTYKNYFDVIDIDPFGCCSEFIESAIISVKNGGLICFTSTDMGVLCNNKAKCYLKYSTVIFKTPACHEMALRTLLSCISRSASKHNAYIEPILSISVDFYIRVFVKVTKKIEKAKEVAINNSYYLKCNCYNIYELPILIIDKKYKNSKLKNDKCDICSSNLEIVGPFWNKPIHDKDFILKIIKNIEDFIDNENIKRVIGILRVISLEIDSFLYYCIPDLCSRLKTPCLPLIHIVSALINLGYKVSLTHCKLNSLKTDAKISVLYAIISKYFQINIPDEWKIQSDLEISFKERDEAKKMINKQLFRNLASSNLGPLSKPNKNK